MFVRRTPSRCATGEVVPNFTCAALPAHLAQVNGVPFTSGTHLFAAILSLIFILSAHATNVEPPPDPGLEASVRAADVIAEVEIVAGGPFRAVAMPLKPLKGDTPPVFEV